MKTALSRCSRYLPPFLNFSKFSHAYSRMSSAHSPNGQSGPPSMSYSSQKEPAIVKMININKERTFLAIMSMRLLIITQGPHMRIKELDLREAQRMWGRECKLQVENGRIQETFPLFDASFHLSYTTLVRSPLLCNVNCRGRISQRIQVSGGWDFTSKLPSAWSHSLRARRSSNSTLR